jgi:inner membrane protein
VPVRQICKAEREIMILFGHLGLTYAAFRSFDRLTSNNKIDYRPVLVGAILPDLLDKPLITLISQDSIHSGRIFSHTLIFNLLLLIVGLLLWKFKKKPWLVTLAAASLFHLFLDSMHLYPDILLWPFTSLSQAAGPDITDIIKYAINSILDQPFGKISPDSIWKSLLRPATGIPELLGFIIIAFTAIRIISQKQLKNFIKKGRIS